MTIGQKWVIQVCKCTLNTPIYIYYIIELLNFKFVLILKVGVIMKS